MYESIPAESIFFRGSGLNELWPQPLQGFGAYHTNGGRYHYNSQPTVYVSADPMVALTEIAFYQALRWQKGLGSGLPPVEPFDPPLVSEHFLWAFTINGLGQLMDIQNDQAVQLFGHRTDALMNPSQHYRTTQELAARIRTHPVPHNPEAVGIIAPSVRTPPIPGYQPHQYILFPRPPGFTGKLIRRWSLTIEFLDLLDHPVATQTGIINWKAPRVMLSRARRPVPAYASRPGAMALETRTWHRLEILF